MPKYIAALCLFVPLSLPPAAQADPTVFLHKLVLAARERTRYAVRYDPAYYPIAYPNGDVPAGVGVCADVVIRAYRKLGVDLQQKLHEDMTAHFDLYPSKRIWGLRKPDSNIDHRRVPNLEVFFTRFGKVLPITYEPADYRAGDLVTWRLPGNLPHIGIVVNERSPRSGNPLIAHNIGAGPELSDILFRYPISGHYRYSIEGSR